MKRTLTKLCLMCLVALFTTPSLTSRGAVLDELILPAVFNLGGSAEIEFFLEGYSQGTLYSSATPSTSGAANLDAAAGISADGAQPTIGSVAGFGEDTWGVGRINEIRVHPIGGGPGVTVYSEGVVLGDGMPRQLTLMFYNAVDIEMININPNPPPGIPNFQVLRSQGIRFDLYEDTNLDFMNLGSGGRVDLDTYTGVTEGDLVLSGNGDADHFTFLSDGASPGNPDADFEVNFSADTDEGTGEAFFEVRGEGTWDSTFDSNAIDNGTRSGLDATADLRVAFDTSGSGAQAPSFVFQIESASGQLIAIPEPSALTLLGTLSVLACTRRRKR